MTIWDSLKTKYASTQNPPPKYQFAGAEFIREFTKTASDYGCTDQEINEHLEFLESNYQRTTARS